MNERIQKLKDQCWVEKRWDNDMWIEKHIDQEKFAELIVRECLDILDDEDDGELAGRSVRIAAIRIKKHFGVEK